MAERLRPADPKAIEAAVGRMKIGLRGLDDLVWQLEASIAASKRAGGSLSVEVYQGIQRVGRDRLNEIQGVLDCLTVGGKRPKDIGALAETARGGTDTD